MSTTEISLETKLFIKSLLGKSFTAALKRSPGGKRFLINFYEEVEKNLFEIIDHIIKTEKKQEDYLKQLTEIAQLVDTKGVMLNDLKQRLKEQN